MNLIEMANRLDKQKCKIVHINHDQIFNLFELSFSYKQEHEKEINDNLSCYHGQYWNCTDSFVGDRFYYLNEQFICFSRQLGRKYNEEFYFLSPESYFTLKSFLEKFSEKCKPYIELIDKNESLNDYYQVLYTEQLIKGVHDSAFAVPLSKSCSESCFELSIEIDFTKLIRNSGARRVVDKNGFKWSLDDLYFKIPLKNKSNESC